MSALENCAKAISKARSLRNLNMFITETFETASEQAKLSQKRIKEGQAKSKIDGALCTIKDNFCTRSIKTTAGSKMLESYIPPYNATVVERLEQAGSIMLGKTNLDEFGMGTVSNSYFGTVKNPYNVAKNKPWDDPRSNDFYISGGSSGGSAASVSSGIADFSIGSDTGGSVRNPASMCGCIGYKPSYGLISRHGLIPLNNYFDTVGIMSMTIECLANVLNVVAGPDLNDSTSIKSKFEPIQIDQDFNPNKLKIGIPKEFFPNGLSESNLEAWKKAVQVFTKHSGAEIVSISLPNSIYSMSCYSVLTSCEIASNFSRYDGLRFGHHTDLHSGLKSDEYTFEKIVTKNRDESLGPTVKSRLVSGNYFLLKDNYEKYFLKSHQIKQLIWQDFERVFNQESIDLIITPTCFHETPTYADYLRQEEPFDEKDFFTACANIAGVPAISIPCHTSSKTGLPVGVQLISNWKRDNLLLNTAGWFIRSNTSDQFRLGSPTGPY